MVGGLSVDKAHDKAHDKGPVTWEIVATFFGELLVGADMIGGRMDFNLKQYVRYYVLLSSAGRVRDGPR